MLNNSLSFYFLAVYLALVPQVYFAVNMFLRGFNFPLIPGAYSGPDK